MGSCLGEKNMRMLSNIIFPSATDDFVPGPAPCLSPRSAQFPVTHRRHRSRSVTGTMSYDPHTTVASKSCFPFLNMLFISLVNLLK